MSAPTTRKSPVGWSTWLGRRIRQDGPETIGISTQTLAEQALASENFGVAADLVGYFHGEMERMNKALYTWLGQILAHRAELDGVPPTTATTHAGSTITAMAGFEAGAGDRAAVLDLIANRDANGATQRLELMRVRIAAIHDDLVFWIQGLLTDLARTHDEQAVCDVVVRTFDTLWRPRYESWDEMTALERLQLSVEGMRGHLSGPRRRGDVGVIDEEDRYVMVLDPCGSCGVLRRGDPDSGRPPCNPAGTTRPHDWAWRRIGLGWYAAHSAIIMEWLPMQRGRPPLRPLKGCDQDGPCRWYIYKEPGAAVQLEVVI